MARWGDEKTLKFICTYRDHECLWNIRSPLYKSKLSRQRAYQSIVSSLNDKRMDLKSVKIKIKNLRSIYHTELRKVRDSKRSADGSVYRPSLSWFDEIHSFLGDLSETPQSTTSVIETQISSADSELLTQATAEPTSIKSLTSKLKLTPTIYNITSSAPHHHPSKPKQKKLILKHYSNESLNPLQQLENLSRVVNSKTTHTEDEFHYFALSVAAQLRSLPLHMAIESQSKIQNILSSARLSAIFSKTSSSNNSDQSWSAQDKINTDDSDRVSNNDSPTTQFQQSVIVTIKRESETD